MPFSIVGFVSELNKHESVFALSIMSFAGLKKDFRLQFVMRKRESLHLFLIKLNMQLRYWTNLQFGSVHWLRGSLPISTTTLPFHLLASYTMTILQRNIKEHLLSRKGNFIFLKLGKDLPLGKVNLHSFHPYVR